ncbi:MAG TPA: prepilin-type N-terminal cleavage/methylation domain-containing protein [Verrucomicrobiales bacterium]|jgi:prepilin-type N-terminal cleavage/methylation domain-containing protein|nr:prepilin-type N-terminal cleavage/methylation domain-containing protein [Verrucomicrobiales bacterium]
MSRRGFTLMEIMIVLAIIALVFTGSYKGITSMNEQAELKKPFDDLRSMAKTAWQRAMQEQRAWQIHFYPDRFILEPKLAVNKDDQQMFADSDRQKGRAAGVKPVTLPPDMIVEVRRWGQPQWVQLKNKMEAAWVFEQSGLCEPISVRFTNDRGTVGAQFDPLTASVKEEIADRDGA